MTSAGERPGLSVQTKKLTSKDPNVGKYDAWAPLITIDGIGPVVRRIVVRAIEGDLILKVKDTGLDTYCSYLVNRQQLCDTSPYFSTLLNPTKFMEGIELDGKMRELVKKHGKHGSIPMKDIPVILLEDIGEIPATVRAEEAFTLFLCILHKPVLPRSPPGWSLLAILAIIADRFDAIKMVADFVATQHDWTKRSFSWDEKTPLSAKDEKLIRQQILVAWRFGIPLLLKKQSATLIVADSIVWNEEDSCVNQDVDALWWNLPQGLEEELICRRQWLLETLSSLQRHFINLYISQPNQCKYGYDSSPACNSFQLGEMIRFFSRTDTLRIGTTFYPSLESQTMRGNILGLLNTLRACPGYQIDSNHAHCGIRTRFVTGLELIMPLVQVGVCARCWKDNAQAESWESSPAKGKWPIASRSQLGRGIRGCDAHHRAKAMYTAEERDWTFQPS